MSVQHTVADEKNVTLKCVRNRPENRISFSNAFIEINSTLHLKSICVTGHPFFMVVLWNDKRSQR